MTTYHHTWVEKNTHFLAFGLDRETDEATLGSYLQMFTDDDVLKTLLPRMTDTELEEVFLNITGLLKKHFTEEEYHTLFLKEER